MTFPPGLRRPQRMSSSVVFEHPSRTAALRREEVATSSRISAIVSISGIVIGGRVQDKG